MCTFLAIVSSFSDWIWLFRPDFSFLKTLRGCTRVSNKEHWNPKEKEETEVQGRNFRLWVCGVCRRDGGWWRQFPRVWVVPRCEFEDWRDIGTNPILSSFKININWSYYEDKVKTVFIKKYYEDKGKNSFLHYIFK